MVWVSIEIKESSVECLASWLLFAGLNMEVIQQEGLFDPWFWFGLWFISLLLLLSLRWGLVTCSILDCGFADEIINLGAYLVIFEGCLVLDCFALNRVWDVINTWLLIKCTLFGVMRFKERRWFVIVMFGERWVRLWRCTEGDLSLKWSWCRSNYFWYF